jgi:L-fuconolactonase
MPNNDPWLQQVREDIVDPAQPIIDPHHHLWFMGPQFAYRTFDYLVSDLAADLGSGHHIVATVFIEARANARPDGPMHLRTVGETEWVNSVASEHAKAHPGQPVVAAGIVGRADLTLDIALVDEQLDTHMAAAPQRFRGIRSGTTWSDDPAVIGSHAMNARHLMMDASFRRGLARLAPRGLSFESWLFHTQLPELLDLVVAFPDTRFIVNHLAAPLGAGQYASQREQVFKDWRKGITELARHPNVFMKLGGAAMHMFGLEWDKQARPPTSDQMVKDTAHLYRAAIDAFSPARCMFESNFPVDRVGCSYAVMWNSFKKIAAGYSPAERNDLFCNTAARAYRLPNFAV